jgi:outer membrane protein insertion porin family
MRWLLPILALASALGFAQTRPARKAPAARKAAAPAPGADKWPIQSLAVEGSPDYPSDQVLAVAGLKIGQLAGKTEFDAAHDRLLASGLFETVGYRFEPGPDGKGYKAVFQVTEVGPILPVRFNNLGAPDADLEAMLRAKDPLYIKGKLAASRPLIERYSAWIKEYLAARNADSKITGGVSPWPEQLTVVFRPDRDLPVVALVSFEGGKAIPNDDLSVAAAGAAIGAAYTEERFRDILDHSIRSVYEARGLMRVSFPKIRIEPAAGEVKGLHVFVTVAEGEEYKLGKVSVAGASPFEPDAAIKAGDFKPNQAANFDRVRDGVEAIRKMARRAGYLDAAVSFDREIHDAEKTVDIAIRIDAGPRYTMRKLAIEGLELTGEAEIKRMWSMSAGKPFDPDYPDLFLTRIREQGLFDNLGKTRAEVALDYKAHAADVTLVFTGAAETQPGRGGRGRGGREFVVRSPAM